MLSVFGFGLSSIGLPELIVILLIVLLLFGARRLPEIFSSFGKGLKTFRDAQRDDSVDVTPAAKEIGTNTDLAEAEELKEKVKSSG